MKEISMKWIRIVATSLTFAVVLVGGSTFAAD